MWDEISQEERACYMPHTNTVGGLCREHSHLVTTKLDSFEAAVSIGRALVDGIVHFGREASVIALGSFGSDLRGAYPVVVSPTCKSESPATSRSSQMRFFRS